MHTMEIYFKSIVGKIFTKYSQDIIEEILSPDNRFNEWALRVSIAL